MTLPGCDGPGMVHLGFWAIIAAMRRSELLVVTVFCPHFERPVSASRNAVNERLVDCTSKRECVRESQDERGVVVATYPVGCPVFRTPG